MSNAFYIPGYRRCKIAMVLYGLTLFTFGVSQIWSPLCLILLGQRTTAEAFAIVQCKEGLPDLILTGALHDQAKFETHDRSITFWNQFRYHTSDGQFVEIRCPIGSQIKPLYPLLDEDGLPTTALIYFDSKNTQTVVFPLIVSTWFAPGVLIVVGLICMLVGSVLYYWSDKPIELPPIHKS